MNRRYYKSKKGCGGITQLLNKRKRDVLRDVDINIIGYRSGRTVWGCKQYGLNYYKRREYWLVLPRYEDTAVTGANRAFSLVQKEDNERPTD